MFVRKRLYHFPWHVREYTDRDGERRIAVRGEALSDGNARRHRALHGAGLTATIGDRLDVITYHSHNIPFVNVDTTKIYGQANHEGVPVHFELPKDESVDAMEFATKMRRTRRIDRVAVDDVYGVVMTARVTASTADWGVISRVMDDFRHGDTVQWLAYDNIIKELTRCGHLRDWNLQSKDPEVTEKMRELVRLLRMEGNLEIYRRDLIDKTDDDEWVDNWYRVPCLKVERLDEALEAAIDELESNGLIAGGVPADLSDQATETMEGE